MYQVKYKCAYRDHWYDDREFDDWGEAVKRGRVVANHRRGLPVVIKLTRFDPGTHLGPDGLPLWMSQRGEESVLTPVGSPAADGLRTWAMRPVQ